METKLIAMIVGVALVLTTATAVYTQLALAASSSGESGKDGASGAAGIIGLHAQNNPHCSQTPTGALIPNINHNN
jgi:hypothetical protein